MSIRTLWPAGWLALFTAIGAGLLTELHRHAESRIADHDNAAWLRVLNELIPQDSHDNALARDTVLLTDPSLPGDGHLKAWRARSKGQPVAIAMQVVAPDGYDGPIRLLIGIRADGTLLGVRALAQHETPGLGDGIELRNGNWILGFDGKSLRDPPDRGWRVKRDGGEFDQLSSATITPRAVVGAVHQALIYFEAHRDTLFARSP